MKKIISVLLVITIITGIASVSVCAHSKLNKIYLKTARVEVEEGATEVQIPITVEYASGTLLAAMFNVTVEGATVTKVARGSAVDGQFQQTIADGMATVMLVNGSDSGNSLSSGSELAIVTITFAKAAKEGDSVKITIEPSENGADFTDADLNNQQGVGGTFDAITVVRSFMPGDVDNSGDLTAKDIIYIMKYIVAKKVKPIPTFVEAAADFDGDGDVNAKDIIKIMKKIIEISTAK